MDQKQIAKQMVEFNKVIFDNSFASMITLQDQTEKIINGFLEKSAWMTPEGKKTISDWISSYKKGRDDFKTAVDDRYKKVAEYFARVEKS